MPTTLIGLLLFVVLLLPGFAYVAVRERSIPNRVISPFRETVNMAIVSTVAMLGGAVVLAMGRFFAPAHTPDVGRMIRVGLSDYAEDGYPLLFAWGAAMLIVPTAVASSVAWTLRNRTPHPSSSSAWRRLFEEWQNNRHIEVTCALDDGSWVRGRVRSFDDSSQDLADRDLILESPISIALAGPGEEFQRYDTSAACLSARRIVSMYINYFDIEVYEPTSDPYPTESATAASTGAWADRAALMEVDPAVQVERPAAAAPRCGADPRASRYEQNAAQTSDSGRSGPPSSPALAEAAGSPASASASHQPCQPLGQVVRAPEPPDQPPELEPAEDRSSAGAVEVAQ